MAKRQAGTAEREVAELAQATLLARVKERNPTLTEAAFKLHREGPSSN